MLIILLFLISKTYLQWICYYILLTPQKIKKRKKKKYKEKIQNTRGYTWKKPKRLLKLIVKDQITSGKVGGPKCTKLL